MDRRQWLARAGAAAALSTWGTALPAATADAGVDPALRQRMVQAALHIARQKIRGGPHDAVYPKPFVDAAFSSNIFYWDTCFIACYAKYHQDELPVANALENFYQRMDADGHICREFTAQGEPFWPKEHPVSVNPPLLAFAELELHAVRPQLPRLRRIYPLLKRHFDYLFQTFRMEDGLFFSDAFGSGMDNIPRYPDGWQDDGAGIRLRHLYPEVFRYEGLAPAWNRQGRSVDFSAQMALFAENLIHIAQQVGRGADVSALRARRAEIIAALNRHCWSERDGCYYDLGYGRQIPRMHIGMFWTLLAGVARPAQARRLVGHLTNPAKFWRRIPVASFPADQAGYAPEGAYWLGSVWAPTNYMVIRGLVRYGQTAVARRLVQRYYGAVAALFERDGTFYENYAPDAVERGSQSQPDFCGWTAIVPITLEREWMRASA